LAVRSTPYAEDNFGRYPEDEIQDASLFMANVMQSFTGNDGANFAVVKSEFASSWKTRPHVWADWYKRLKPISDRLVGVQITCKDAVDVIYRFAENEKAVIYIDPPYHGFERYYEEKVKYEMVEAVFACRGKVLVSEYEGAERFFKHWNRATRDVVNHTGKERREYLFMNF